MLAFALWRHEGDHHGECYGYMYAERRLAAAVESTDDSVQSRRESLPLVVATLPALAAIAFLH